MKPNSARPKISIVIPSFNQAVFLRQTLESLLTQEYSNFEVIVMDGGSSDDSVQVLQEFQQKYPKTLQWKSEKDRGQTHAINKGLDLAQGEICAYLNSDDVYVPHALERVAQQFEEDKKVQWLTGECDIISESGMRIQRPIQLYKRFFRRLLLLPSLYILNSIAQPATFWRAAFLKQVGGFKENLRYCMDYDCWLRMMQVSPPMVVSQTLAKFRIHSNSKGGTQFKKQFQEEYEVMSGYSSSILMRKLHILHATLVIWIYSWIK